MKETDVIQKKYLDTFENIHIREFADYSLIKLIFNETYYVQQITCKMFLKNFFLDMFTKRPILDYEIKGNELLLLSERFYRNDHDQYWKIICDVFPEKDLVTILSYQSMRDVIKNLSVGKCFHKYFIYKNIYIQLEEIPNNLHRKYFALQLMRLKLFEKRLDEFELCPKVAMCFFDSGFYENLAMQYFKNKDAITITNQHGQPVFRTWNEDRLNQSQILNFKCDYFLAKGEYTKEQFKKAGFDEKSIKIIGNLFYDYPKYKNDEKEYFGVFLDCPTFDFSDETNKQLIEISNVISEKYNLKYYIKLHPQDVGEKYVNRISQNCIGIYDKNYKLDDVFSEISFGILHASAVYLDLINANIKCFRLNSEVDFPLVENELDLFENIEEFDRNIVLWKQKTDSEKQSYMTALQEHYNGNGNGRERINNLVNGLLHGETVS